MACKLSERRIAFWRASCIGKYYSLLFLLVFVPQLLTLLRLDFTRAAETCTGASLPWSGQRPDTFPQSIAWLTANLHFPVIPRSADEEPDDVLQILLACEQFLAIFRGHDKVEELYSPVPGAANFQDTFELHECRQSALAPGAPLFNLLAPYVPRAEKIGTASYMKAYCRLACLLYLKCATWHCRNNPSRLTQYYRWLDGEMKAQSLDTNPSIEGLMWIFLLKDGNVDISEGWQSRPITDGERNWFISRILRVAKRLIMNGHHETWQRMNQVLWGILTVPEDTSGDGLPWDDELLRQEILGDLYVGPPLELSADRLVETDDIAMP